MRTLLLIAAIVAIVLASDKGTNKEDWRDTPLTTQLWTVISSGSANELKEILASDPKAASARSSDGRGPLWWAHEYGHPEMVKMLIESGANPNEKDGDGKKPEEVTTIGPTEWAASQAAAEVEEDTAPYDGGNDEEDDE